MLSAVAWTGAGGDMSWNNAANWSGNATPGQQDDVTIANMGAATPITVSGSAVDIHSLNSSNSIEITNTSFSLESSSTVNAAFQVDAGASLAVNGGVGFNCCRRGGIEQRLIHGGGRKRRRLDLSGGADAICRFDEQCGDPEHQRFVPGFQQPVEQRRERRYGNFTGTGLTLLAAFDNAGAL